MRTCKATVRSCGTPTGWRQGGRCDNCREAHNEDVNRRRRARRALPPETVLAYAELLESGEDPAAAARKLGINPTQAKALPKDHPRVAEALTMTSRPDGLPLSQEARQADYLKALIDCNGVVQDALVATNVQMVPTLLRWRKDQAFKSAEQALTEWIKQRAVTPARRRRHARTGPGQYEQFLTLLKDPAVSLIKAAGQAGLSRGNIEYRIKNDEEFARRLDDLRPVGPGGRRTRPRG